MNTRNRRNVPIFVALASIVLIVLVIALAGIGGGGTGTTPKVADYPPIIPDTTKVLSSSTVQNLSSISSDGFIYTFSHDTPELDQLAIGDVMVSGISAQSPDGILRKVTGVQHEGTRVVVTTSQAALTDAIQSGTIHLHRQLTPADVAQLPNTSHTTTLAVPIKPDLDYNCTMSQNFDCSFNNLVLYDQDGNLQSQSDQVRANGDINFSPSYNFDLSIQDFKLRQMVFTTQLDESAQIEVESGVEISVEKSYQLGKPIKFKPIIFSVGSVPVVVTPVLTLTVNLKGEVSASISTSVEQRMTMTGGVSMSDGQWSLIKNYSNTFQYTPPHVSAGCDFTGSVGPQLQLLFYGVIGPAIQVSGYLELAADPLQSPWWKLYGGLKTEAEIKVEIFSHLFVDYSTVIFDFRKLLAEAGVNPNPTIIAATSVGTTTGAPPLISSTNSKTILLFDTSGSMLEDEPSGTIKLDAAKAAATNILDVVAAENQAEAIAGQQVGIVDFNQNTNTDASLSTDISTVKSAVQSLNANGGTGMPLGLQTAISMFSGNSNGKSIIILLTDGMPNVGLNGETDVPTVRKQVLDLAAQAGQKGICIYTVGFGDPTLGNGSDYGLDEDFLKQVASDSGCGFYQNAQNAWQLANVYIDLRHSSTGNTLLQKSGQINQGENVDLGSVQVPDNQSMMLFTLNWPGSSLAPILTDPTGRKVDSNYPGASFSTTKTLTSIIIQNPPAGQWEVVAQGVDVPEGTTNYNAVLSIRANPNPPAAPSTQPQIPNSSAFPVVIIFLVLAGGAVGIYVLSQTVKRRQPLTASGYGTGNAQLRALNGAMTGQAFMMMDGLIIGRGSNCNLRLDDRSVSRQHVRLRYASGRWYIQDMNSAGGTFVNGLRVNAVALNNGDRVRIGSNEFEFRA